MLHEDSISDRDGAAEMPPMRVAMQAYPLLLPHSGRHALDVARSGAMFRTSGPRRTGDVAVKKLRNMGSAVLLLNFHEVGSTHLCSNGVTV